jgi:hypothetical protein
MKRTLKASDWLLDLFAQARREMAIGDPKTAKKYLDKVVFSLIKIPQKLFILEQWSLLS